MRDHAVLNRARMPRDSQKSGLARLKMSCGGSLRNKCTVDLENLTCSLIVNVKSSKWSCVSRWSIEGDRFSPGQYLVRGAYLGAGFQYVGISIVLCKPLYFIAQPLFFWFHYHKILACQYKECDRVRMAGCATWCLGNQAEQDTSIFHNKLGIDLSIQFELGLTKIQIIWKYLAVTANLGAVMYAKTAYDQATFKWLVSSFLHVPIVIKVIYNDLFNRDEIQGIETILVSQRIW